MCAGDSRGADVTWRRLIFWIVYLVTWVPLFILFVLGYFAEGVIKHMNRLERWSEE